MSDAVVAIYPNPATDKIYVDLSSGSSPVSYRISGILGQQVLSGLSQNSHFEIALPGIAPGLYIVEIVAGVLKTRTKILIDSKF